MFGEVMTPDAPRRKREIKVSTVSTAKLESQTTNASTKAENESESTKSNSETFIDTSKSTASGSSYGGKDFSSGPSKNTKRKCKFLSFVIL